MASKRKVDTVAALEAKLKQAKGVTLTTGEEALIRRYDTEVAEEIRDGLLLNLPKGVYCKLAGRHQRVVDDQAVRYEMPIDGPKIDLYQVVKKFHDILGEWGPTIRELQGEEGTLRIEKMKEEIELLKKRSKAIDIDIKNRQSEFIDRATLRIRMEWLANKLRGFSERLGRRFGGDAQALFNTLLTQIEEELN